MNNSVRIIAGNLRGRKIHFHPGEGLRPTLDVIRETLFNWLMLDIQGACCLDLFAGTGALGFEALSRDAGHVTFIDASRSAVKDLQAHLHAFGFSAQVEVLQGNALSYSTDQVYDLIFLDPPFHQGLVEQALSLIQKNNWLTPDGMVYFEVERELDLTPVLSENWHIHRHKKMGEVQYGLLIKRIENAGIIHRTE